jgi:hypothetical protein
MSFIQQASVQLKFEVFTEVEMHVFVLCYCSPLSKYHHFVVPTYLSRTHWRSPHEIKRLGLRAQVAGTIVLIWPWLSWLVGGGDRGYKKHFVLFSLGAGITQWV